MWVKGARRVGPRRVVAEGWGARRVGPKISRFFSLSRRKMRSFLPSGGVRSAGALKCARLEFSSCRALAKVGLAKVRFGRSRFGPKSAMTVRCGGAVGCCGGVVGVLLGCCWGGVGVVGGSGGGHGKWA